SEQPVGGVVVPAAQGRFDLPVNVPAAVSAHAHQNDRDRRIPEILLSDLAHHVFRISAVDEIVVCRHPEGLRRKDALAICPAVDKLVNCGTIALVERNENVALRYPRLIGTKESLKRTELTSSLTPHWVVHLSKQIE